jgi:enoyl-CoA hydratase/carnithine racemase
VSAAKELIFSGELIEAAEALRIGLVNRVVPASDVFTTAIGWASALAAGPAAVRGIVKSVIDNGIELTLADGLELERDHFVRLFDNWAAVDQ